MKNTAVGQQSHRFTPAEVDELQQTALNLRRFAETAPFGKDLEYTRFGDYHAELTRCFTRSWAYAVLWLEQNGHEDDAKRLTDLRTDALTCSRGAWEGLDEGGHGVWPDNLRVKIANLIRTIETVIKGFGSGGLVGQDESPEPLADDLSGIQLEADALRMLRQLAGSQRRLHAIEFGLNRRTASRHLRELVRIGLVEWDSKDKKGAAIVPAGREYLKRTS